MNKFIENIVESEEISILDSVENQQDDKNRLNDILFYSLIIIIGVLSIAIIHQGVVELISNKQKSINDNTFNTIIASNNASSIDKEIIFNSKIKPINNNVKNITAKKINNNMTVNSIYKKINQSENNTVSNEVLLASLPTFGSGFYLKNNENKILTNKNAKNSAMINTDALNIENYIKEISSVSQQNNLKQLASNRQMLSDKDSQFMPVVDLANSLIEGNLLEKKDIDFYEYQQQVVNVLTSIDRKNLSEQDKNNVSSILSYISNVKPLQVGSNKSTINFNYPDSNNIQKDPANYVMSCMDQTVRVYSHVVNNLAAVNLGMINN